MRSHQGGSEDSGDASAAKQLEELQDEIDHLAARAASVNSSVDRLKQQQEPRAWPARDAAERQESMKINLSRAQTPPNTAMRQGKESLRPHPPLTSRPSRSFSAA